MFLFLVNDFIIDLACYNKTALLFESSVAKINIFLQKKPALTFSVKQKHIQSDLFNKTPLSPQNWNLNSTLLILQYLKNSSNGRIREKLLKNKL